MNLQEDLNLYKLESIGYKLIADMLQDELRKMKIKCEQHTFDLLVNEPPFNTVFYKRYKDYATLFNMPVVIDLIGQVRDKSDILTKIFISMTYRIYELEERLGIKNGDHWFSLEMLDEITPNDCPPDED